MCALTGILLDTAECGEAGQRARVERAHEHLDLGKLKFFKAAVCLVSKWTTRSATRLDNIRDRVRVRVRVRVRIRVHRSV